MKAVHQAKCQKEWIDQWKQSPRYQKMAKIDPDLPNHSMFKALTSLSRQEASILIQLRTGIIGLNGFLKKIKQQQSALCETCRAPETVNHFLFFCRHYQEQRCNRKHFKATATFARNTGRFTHYQSHTFQSCHYIHIVVYFCMLIYVRDPGSFDGRWRTTDRLPAAARD
ncbi:hypothetical protein AcV5_010542 [Taiwanofungus camphoratus]|nr:hypothetical protein AcV5_010542 [Antrodia cinnamomea]